MSQTVQITDSLSSITDSDRVFLAEAYNEALGGYEQGGVPVGAVMTRNGAIFARGRNKRMQELDPIMHGETDCLRNAGLQDNYDGVEIYTTLSPCMMCTGAILHFGIRRVVVGEDVNFPGNINLLLSHGVKVALANDEACIKLMTRFIREQPEIWFEDIAVREHT